MFRVSPAPIIRSTQTVVTTTGTGHEFGNVMIKSGKKESMDEQLHHFGHGQSEGAARPWTLFNRILSLHLQIHDLYQWL